jgi:hypothetical protein
MARQWLGRWPVAYRLTLSLFVVNLAACGEIDDDDVEALRSALTGPSMGSTVPAYWTADPNNATDNAEWSRLYATLDNTSFGDPNVVVVTGAVPDARVVTGYRGGPPLTFSQDLQDRIDRIHQGGNIALGYLWFHPDMMTIQMVDEEKTRWMYYGIDGIFFDDAFRNTTADAEVSRMRYVMWRTYFETQTSHVMVVFNWGAAGYRAPDNTLTMQRYVECAIQDARETLGDPMDVRFVTQEKDYAYYTTTAVNDWAASSWNWVNAYHPKHFIHIVHSVTSFDTTAVRQLIDFAAARNSGWVYFTDQPYGQFASNTLAANQIQELATYGRTRTYPGVAVDPLPSTPCPPMVFP